MKEGNTKTQKYYKNTHRIIKQISYTLYGVTTFWGAVSSITPLPIRIIAIALFCIMVTLTAFFAYKRDKFGIEGIVRLHPNSDDNYNDIAEHFETAKKIQIIAYHGEKILSGTRDKLIAAIDRGAEVQLLIAREESVLLEDVWKIEEGDEKEKVKESRKIINYINDKTIHQTNRLVFHEYNTEARYALIAVDEKWAWWTPYHPGERVENTTSIILTDEGDTSIIKECLEHFRILWEELEKGGNANVSVTP
jgi:hypothetical protein